MVRGGWVGGSGWTCRGPRPLDRAGGRDGTFSLRFESGRVRIVRGEVAVLCLPTPAKVCFTFGVLASHRRFHESKGALPHACVVHWLLPWQLLPFAGAEGERWRKAADELPQGDRLLPAVEHDGRV